MKPVVSILRQTFRSVLTLALLGSSTITQAFEVEQLNTRYEAGQYRLSMTVILAAPLHQVEAVLRDYAHYPELDPRILEARVLNSSTPGTVQLFTRIHVCVSLLCRNVERIEQVEERPGEMVATIIPEHSDAEQGSTHTVLSAQGERTQVRYTTFIVPKFWVPAWFGRALMLRTLRDGTLNLFQHIEQRAATPLSTSSTSALSDHEKSY